MKFHAFRYGPEGVTHRVVCLYGTHVDAMRKIKARVLFDGYDLETSKFVVRSQEEVERVWEADRSHPECVCCGKCCEDHLCLVAKEMGFEGPPCSRLMPKGLGGRLCGLVMDLHPDRSLPMMRFLYMGNASGPPKEGGCGYHAGVPEEEDDG